MITQNSRTVGSTKRLYEQSNVADVWVLSEYGKYLENERNFDDKLSINDNDKSKDMYKLSTSTYV